MKQTSNKSLSLCSIKINGKAISEYKIYSTADASPNRGVGNILVGACSRRLADNILNKFSGETVEVVTEMGDEKGAYIVLEPKSMDYTHYRTELRDGNLYVYGSYKSCYEFLDYFVKQGIKDVDITEGFEGDIDKPKLYTKEELWYVLQKAQNEPNRVIIGQESVGNIKTPYAGSIDLFRAGTEGYDPGIVGVDLGWAGICLYRDMRGEKKANDELKSQQFCEMVEYAEMGGFFTVGSHFHNPNREGYAHKGNNGGLRFEAMGFLGKDDAFRDLVTPGTEFNKNFQDELDACIEYLKYFKEIGLPVIYRPFHEMTQNTFWWAMVQKFPDGTKYYIEKECFVNLWKYVYKAFTEAGLDNLIWHFCPDFFAIDCLSGYPGDEYCDLVGSDWYTGGVGKLEIIEHCGLRTLENLMKVGKPIGIGEFGQWDVHESSLDYVKDFREIFNQGYQLSYAMVWTVNHSFLKLGKGKEAMDSGVFICREELVDWFAEARRELNK
ncbi:MAG: hypothetical protein IKT56_03200 [Clostridia bacterium]|nr:hypothetical protein [Clostridia bacterium]